MNASLLVTVGLVGTIVLGALPSPGAQAPPADARLAPLPSSSPDLDRAAADLAEGRLDEAHARFEQLAGEASRPGFVRALAVLGLAEVAVARNDATAARAAWRQLTDDGTLPRAYRDLASLRTTAAERVGEGRPGYDPAAHRVTLPAIPPAAVTLYVEPDGDDAGDGSEERPLRSLNAARDAVRAWRRSQKDRAAEGSVVIAVGGGAYSVGETLRLRREDSGTTRSPVVYRSKPGQRPVFHGGVSIASWKTVADARLRDRLAPAVRDRVVVADLKALGVTDFGDATALRKRPELFCDGEPQTLARWPNEGFVKTGELLGTDTFKVWSSIPGCKDGKFRFVEERPAEWTEEPDVRLYGYWFWDWFEEYQKVAAIDPEARSFTLSPPYSNYGYRKDQRYYATNVLCELDRPGEWYLDRRDGVVYWSPPENVDVSKVSTVLSVLDEPHVELEDVEHVLFVGLTFQDGRGNGIEIRGGAGVLVAGCTFRRLGGDAARIQGGRSHGVFGCTMHTLGCGGADVHGGDRGDLSRGEHFVENCTVYDISRLKRTYTPAVRLDGCGNRVAHNLFERMPSSAMRIEGNEQRIELNVVRHVVEESDDQGGVDMFGNPLYRGVIIRWNRWSDIGGGTHCGGAGVRLDDMISGVTVHGNVFERCGAVQFGGVQIHGGKENLVDGNVFLDCFAGISFSRWGESRWLESIERFLAQAAAPPYSNRYPELSRLRENPDVSFVCRNVFSRCGQTFLRDGGVQQTALNVVSDRAVDLQRLSSPTALREDPRLLDVLLDPIPVDDMGPYDHPWRAEPGR